MRSMVEGVRVVIRAQKEARLIGRDPTPAVEITATPSTTPSARSPSPSG
jgi:hypothetical protein